VRWVSENCRPFEIVADRGFNSLMKTGRPGYWIPHPTVVSRDVKLAFARTRQRLSKMLRVSQQSFIDISKTCTHYPRTPQDYPGDISFATDAWTSSNHKSFVAITAHIVDDDGEPLVILLDFLELPEVR
jgi:hypothetical protein